MSVLGPQVPKLPMRAYAGASFAVLVKLWKNKELGEHFPLTGYSVAFHVEGVGNLSGIVVDEETGEIEVTLTPEETAQIASSGNRYPQYSLSISKAGKTYYLLAGSFTDESVTRGYVNSAAQEANLSINEPAPLELEVELGAGAGSEGATGPTGPEGATGATGPEGKGATGATGSEGGKGATGSTGPEGKGATGATGVEGGKGATGATGPEGGKGATGPTGPEGLKGASGTAGEKGATGATGSEGTKGASGATGPTGPEGAAGTKGATGATGPEGLSSVAGYELEVEALKAVAEKRGDYFEGKLKTGQESNEKYYKILKIFNQEGGEISEIPEAVRYTVLASENKPIEAGSAVAAILVYADIVNNAKGEVKVGLVAKQGIAEKAKVNVTLGFLSKVAPGKEALGPTGPTGPAGSEGGKGATGATGVEGVKGASGATGPTGPEGGKGATGATGVEGGKGATGSEGGKGATGATGPRGEVEWVGAWKAATAYTKGQAVTNNGTSYVCIKAMSSGEDHEPPNATYWEVLAEKGATGVEGGKGATGPTGPEGPKGATGPTGAEGGKGATGATGSSLASLNGKTFAINGTVAAEAYPGFNLRIESGEEYELVGMDLELQEGTSAEVTLRVNGAAVSASYEKIKVEKSEVKRVSSAKTFTNSNDKAYFDLNVLAVSSAKKLSVTVYFRRTK